MTVQRLVPVIGCTPTRKVVDTFKFARRRFLNSIHFRLDLTTMVYIFLLHIISKLTQRSQNTTREWADRSCITKGYIYITINMFSGCSSTYLSAFLVWNPTLNRNLEASSVLIIARFSMSCV